MDEVAAKAEEQTVETTVEAMKEDNATTVNGSKTPESVSASRPAATKKKPVISSNLIKPTASSSLRVSGSTPVTIRRNSTGGVTDKSVGVSKVLPKQMSTTASHTDPVRRSLPDLRRSSVSTLSAKTVSKASLPDSRKSIPVSPGSWSSTKSTGSSLSKPESSARPALSGSVSSKRVPSSSVDSSGSRTTSGRTVSRVSSPSAGTSPSGSSARRSKSLSTPLDRSSNFSGRKKTATPETRDSRLIILPKVEVKVGDDMRLDLRGHRIRSLTSGGLHLSPNLEFVYLRDNLLSALEGIEILNRVKVLDLSFNDFKGPGFEPLENCKMLQQLYLAGNQISSLASLPQLPNLEFLSVAQNKLKSLAMASQPRLQVLAASKNKITTLKDFPYLPVLEHLRVEENPLLKISHLEAASILLVGPTLKKFNDRDLSREEVAIAKRYPPQTALCLREGWEFCKSDLAAESTFRFLVERWKDTLPSGYLIKEAYVDRPSEEAPCQCHFGLVQESPTATDQELALKFQWSVADRSLSNFVPILDATKEVYWPKNEDIGKILKIECTPVMGESEYPSIFAISSPVLRGKGIPKVVSLELHGELVEGNIIKGQAVVAWCGGTPGKCITSWLRRKWNGSPVVIDGAEDEEYRLSLDDVGSSMVFMYTPVTEGGARGEPQYKYTEFVKAAPPSVSNVRITGDAVEGCVLKGTGDYFGGKEGPSKFEWLRKNKETGELLLISAGTSEYTLTQEDVGTLVTFVYIPANFEGLEGEPVSTLSSVVKPAPPKVTDAKIVGDLRENSKVTVTGTVTGGTEGSSRVQWFKSRCSILEGGNSLEELSTLKVAKAFRIPLGAVGYYIVAKYTPMAPDGECGEPVYVLSERAVETLPPSLNFLSITGDNIEGGILTASYGYIGGHEGKSIYEWHYHKAENDLPGTLIPETSGLLHYTISKEAIGKFVSFQCIPVRDDGIVGEARTCMCQERVRPGNPRAVSLQVVGAAVEGTMLSAEKEYWGGIEGASVFRWYRTNSDGTPCEIKGATTSSYLLSVDDIGFFISVSYEPVRNDWARGSTVISAEIQVWLNRVEIVEKKVNDLASARNVQLQRLYLCGFCSRNLISSYRYGKSVLLRLREVNELKTKAFDVIAEKLPGVVPYRPFPLTTVGQETMLEKAWKHLMEDGVGIMGLYGMGGVGKTTLLTQINNKFSNDKCGFDFVIWVVVSKELHVEKIQDEIAQKVGLGGEEWNQKDESQKGLHLYNFLMKKRFMLFLDDIWVKVDLAEIGVPDPRKQRGCKVAFTTRSQEVCMRMGVENSMEVQCLTEYDAFDLFQKKVGEITLGSDPEIPNLARKVAKKCCGLPLALNVVGETMSCKRTVQEWRHAINVLNSYAAEFSGMDDKILPLLKYSYDSLKGDQVKSCLLYCALFPEDGDIPKEKIIDYWICEGIIDGSEGIEKAEDKGYDIIGSLVGASLLMDGVNWSREDVVRMHDVVREMALWIASELGIQKEAFIVRAGVGLYEISKVKNWNIVKRMSLMENKISHLVDNPQCLKLTTLLLQRGHLSNISRGFFNSMPKLVVLDLSDNERLSELPEISNLVSLQYLNLSHTSIRHLPKGLQELKKIIHLNLEFTRVLESIAGISSLHNLKVLKLRSSGFPWDVETVKELETLEHLEILTTTLDRRSGAGRFLSSHFLMSCTRLLNISDINLKPSEISLPVTMDKLREFIIIICRISEIKMGRICSFLSLVKVGIHDCQSLRELTFLMFAPNLKDLLVARAKDLEDIINKEKACEVENSGGIVPFPNLNRLVLSRLPKLENIYWSPLPFPYLKEIKVAECPNLKKLPLDSKSGKQGDNGLFISYRENEWIEGVQWVDQATKNRFLTSSRPY